MAKTGRVIWGRGVRKTTKKRIQFLTYGKNGARYMGKRGSKKTKKIIKFPTYAKNGARYMEKRGYLVIPLERVPLPHGRAWRPPLRPVCDDGGGWAWGAPRTPPHLPPRRLAPLDHVSVDRDAQREPRLAKTRLKCEMWEKWGATYGRNGCGGPKQIPRRGATARVGRRRRGRRRSSEGRGRRGR